jgi:acyl dehydratase
LNGDKNPLHIDSDFSSVGGFKVPILHGLCTYGFTCKAVYETLLKGDQSLLRQYSARFTSHVFPGETLLVSMWKEDKGVVVLEVKTKERGKVVLQGFAVIGPQ